MNSSLAELTETERQRVTAAIENETARAIDNRADGVADCDALCDARRVGERIADGFALLRGDA